MARVQAKRGNLPETKCRPHIRASQLTYTVKVLSLRGAQRATRQSPGREDGRSVHEQIPFSRGISPLRSDYRPHSGRNDIINKADKSLPPRGRLNRSHTRCHFERRRSRSREIPRIRNGNNHTPITPNTCPQGLPAASLPAGGGSPPYTTIQILAHRGSLPPAHLPAQTLRPQRLTVAVLCDFAVYAGLKA